MKAKRLLATLLAALCALSTACSTATNTDTDPSADTGSPEIVSSDLESIIEEDEDPDSRANAKDNLPDDLNYGDATITILHRGGSDVTNREIFVEEDSTADVVSHAVYTRNGLVEERLGVVIDHIATVDTIDQNGDTSAKLRTNAQAGTDEFNIFSGHMSQSTPLIIEGLLLNLYDKQYLDWEQPWWNQSFIREIKINDKVYFAVGELSQTMISGNYVMYFNKDMFARNFLDEDLYQVVLDGNWTVDRMKDYCAQVYVDSNGNMQKDADDIVGFSLGSGTNSSEHDAFTGSCDIDIITRDDNDQFYISIDNERTYKFIDSIKDLYYNDYYSFVGDNSTGKFMNNTSLFIMGRLSTTETLRDMEANYGIIPMPKLDEDQADYTGFTHNGFSAFGIPLTCDDVDMCAAFLEAMCAENYRTVTPAYYEVALKQKYARDDVVSQMLDMITANIRFDFGFVYSGSLSDILKVFRKINGDQFSSPASMITSNKRVADKLLDKLVADIAELEY